MLRHYIKNSGETEVGPAVPAALTMWRTKGGQHSRPYPELETGG